MSLDFYLSADLGGPEPVGLGAWNITHNLGRMWRAAGCYDALYNSAGRSAEDVLPALKAALHELRTRPDHYRQYDAPNGWGRVENAAAFLEDVVRACERAPKAFVGLSK